MTMPTNTSNPNAATDDLLVRKEIFVKAPLERAFEVFSRQMGAWWPLTSHHVGAVEAKGIVIEERLGGRVFELGVDQSVCVWGHVLTWDPPGRFVFTWELDSTFKVDPKIDTKVEVIFTAAHGGTRVELVHSGLRVYGAKADEMRRIFDSLGGWTGLLAAYGAHAEAG